MAWDCNVDFALKKTKMPMATTLSVTINSLNGQNHLNPIVHYRIQVQWWRFCIPVDMSIKQLHHSTCLQDNGGRGQIIHSSCTQKGFFTTSLFTMSLLLIAGFLLLHITYQAKVTTFNCNPFAKLTATDFCLKCMAFVHDCLGSILGTIILALWKFIIYSFTV